MIKCPDYCSNTPRLRPSDTYRVFWFWKRYCQYPCEYSDRHFDTVIAEYNNVYHAVPNGKKLEVNIGSDEHPSELSSKLESRKQFGVKRNFPRHTWARHSHRRVLAPLRDASHSCATWTAGYAQRGSQHNDTSSTYPHKYIRWVWLNSTSHTLTMSLKLETPRTFPAFPFLPYEIQLNLMQHLYASVEDRKVSIIESPTGTVRWHPLSFIIFW